MLAHLGHRLSPFLPPLMAITLHLLTTATNPLQHLVCEKLQLQTIHDSAPSDPMDATGSGHAAADAEAEQPDEEVEEPEQDLDAAAGQDPDAAATAAAAAGEGGLTAGENGDGGVNGIPAAASAGGGGDGVGDDRHRETRGLCLQVLAQVWQRFPATHDYNDVWPEFMVAVQPLAARLHMEAVGEK